MKRITAELGDNRYDIEIERGSFASFGEKLRAFTAAEKAAVITDSRVDRLYGKALQEQLEHAGLYCRRIVFPEGEKSKNLQTLERVYEELAAMELTRKDVIAAFGGGVTGDLGGLAAATWLRGVPLIQIPTSLLAQIDSSVGGKTAVDLGAGKNLVGAFYQPKAVWIDPDLLDTLPERYLHDGMAEVIKYGCIKDRSLFERLEGITSRSDLLSQIEDIIAVCCQIKADVVKDDVFDTGGRMILNFGHTLGHAAEQYYQYETYTHGEGVAMGMAAITQCMEREGWTQPGTAARIQKVLKQFSLPFEIPVPLDDIWPAVGQDKKKAGGCLTLAGISEIGEGFLKTMPIEDAYRLCKGGLR